MEEAKIKKCGRCKKEKPATNKYFSKVKQGLFGLNSICKDCIRKSDRRRYLENKAKQIDYTVYSHTNKINGKIYIGLTKMSTIRRWNNGKGYKRNLIFYDDIEKYGWDNFDHEVIASGLTKEEGENFEILLIKKLETQNSDKGYNLEYGGTRSGKKTEKIKLKTSSSLKYVNGKSVICDSVEFKTINQCAEYYNVKHGVMNRWLSGQSPMPSKFKELGLNFKDESLRVEIRENFSKIKVVCDNKLFSSVKECSLYYNINYGTMTSWLKNINPMPQKFKDMELQYYIEYEQNKEIA